MEKQKRQAEKQLRTGKIKARIIDKVNGIQYLENVYAVRITDRHYSLLVMEDFAPTLGQIDGNVAFLCLDREVKFDNIIGFYKHQHNAFTLLIHEDLDGWYDVT